MAKRSPSPRSQARAEVRKLAEHHPPEVLEAIQDLLTKERPKRRGRPKGSGEDDEAHLRQMASWIVAGEASSVREAARRIARDLPSHSTDATVDRLRRKFAAARTGLVRDVRLRLALQEVPDPADAADILKDYVSEIAEELKEMPDREQAVDSLKTYLSHLVDEVTEAMDVEAVTENLRDEQRFFRRKDIEAAFEEHVEIWDL